MQEILFPTPYYIHAVFYRLKKTCGFKSNVLYKFTQSTPSCQVNRHTHSQRNRRAEGYTLLLLFLILISPTFYLYTITLSEIKNYLFLMCYKSYAINGYSIT